MIFKTINKYVAVSVVLILLAVVGAWAYGVFDAEERYPGNNTALQDAISRKHEAIAQRLATIDDHRQQVADYMRTHSVIDNGYDLMARYDHSLRTERDSISDVDSIIRAFPTITMLQYITDTQYDDTIATNARNILGELCGEGHCQYSDGTYYLGDWVNGKRHGLGFAMQTGKRLRVGEWKRDKYLGEKITYSADRIYGIDISRYQHEKGRKRFSIDWNNLAITSLGTKSRKNIHGEVNYPISFIYIKSTEGTTVFNRYYSKDYVAARKAGYRVGAYHFFSTKTGGKVQARFFCKRSTYHPGDFPPVLDVEPSHAQIKKMGGAQVMFREIRAWLNYVEAAWHVRPVLYISQTFVNRYLPSAPDLMKRYDVWIARYGEYKPDVNLAYWQLCPDGRVRGIHTEVDINVFNGFKEDFEKYR